MHQPPLLNDIEWLPPISGRTPPPALEPKLAAEVKAEFGGLPPFIKRFAACPWAVQMMMCFRFPRFSHVPDRLGKLILLVVSQDSSCRFCYGHARVYLRLTGQSEAQIRKLETDLLQADLPPEHILALDFARLMARASPRPGRAEAAALVRAGVDQRTIAEIATYAAYCVMATRIATLVAMGSSSYTKLAGRWFSPLLGFGIKLFERSRRRPLPPERLPEEALSGPMGSLFARLDGLPMAAIFYRSLRGALESEIIPRPTKLLLFAVVARALQCQNCEDSCRTLLSAEGVSGAELDDVLKRLYGPKLSPLAAKLVPLARETVRYEPSAIQRRMQVLATEISDEELVEFVAVTSLANALARLTVILDCP